MIIPSRLATGTHASGIPLRFFPHTDHTDSCSDDIDWMAVHRAMTGEHPAPELNRDEQREAAIRLVRNGVGRRTISTRLCIYERLVKEWEAEEGLLDDSELCTRPGCRRAAAGRGLCTSCLNQQRLLDRQWKAAIEDLAVAA